MDHIARYNVVSMYNRESAGISDGYPFVLKFGSRTRAKLNFDPLRYGLISRL
jgi:hypothetical protein